MTPTLPARATSMPGPRRDLRTHRQHQLCVAILLEPGEAVTAIAAGDTTRFGW
jgi:hypothetical protein